MKNNKYSGVRVSSLRGFIFRSGSIKRDYNRADVNVKPWEGFTLIEMLVVVGILTLAVGAIIIFLNSVLRGTQKANAINEVKQNSQIIVDSLERQIRGAQEAQNVDITNGLKTVRLSSGSGEYTFIKCLAAPVNNTRNSRVGVAIIPESSIAPDEVPQESLYVSLSNDDIADGVEIDIDSCTLTVYSAEGTVDGKLIPAVVSIEMNILKRAERVDYSASTKIQTTISLRRY